MGVQLHNPSNLYPPVRSNYTQVAITQGARWIHIAGLVALTDDGTLVAGGMAEQVAQVAKNLAAAFEGAGCRPQDIARINIYTVDVDAYRLEGHRHILDLFGGTPPASTLLGVSRLAEPHWLVEIDATGVVD